jgi:hypothetical protein
LRPACASLAAPSLTWPTRCVFSVSACSAGIDQARAHSRAQVARCGPFSVATAYGNRGAGRMVRSLSLRNDLSGLPSVCVRLCQRAWPR